MKNSSFSQKHHAPLILFVYNRLEHTVKTIEALKKNSLSSESDLFIFSDAERESEDKYNVEQVRKYIDSISGFRKVEVIKRDKNRGLAQSIITGVTELMEEYDRVIVLEDDLITSPAFLTFMNKALSFYADNKSIWSIGGYNFPLGVLNFLKEPVYLSFRSCTWGWATWKDRWEKADWELDNYEELLNDRSFRKKFNRAGSDMCSWLRKQKESRLDSWAVKWDVAHCVNDGYCLRPRNSLISNIGFDGSGIHCGTTNKFDVKLASEFAFEFPINITIDAKLNIQIAKYIAGSRSITSIFKSLLRYPINVWNRL